MITLEKLPTNNYDPIGGVRVDQLTKEQLASNAANYEEMSWELEPNIVEQARRILMSIPLVHRTPVQRFSGEAVDQTTLYDTPVPQSYLYSSGEGGNTYALDRQMQLDEYVFMGWGAITSEERDSFLRQARYAVLVDPELLLRDDVIVTPNDISWDVHQRVMDHGVASAKPEDAEAIEEYLASAVRGKDWLEIAARRLAKHMQENPDKQYEIDIEHLGEIKHHGPIDASAIIGTVDMQDNDEYQAYCDYVDSVTNGVIGLRKMGRLTRLFKVR